MPLSTTVTIAERLDQIERENKLLRWIGSVLFAGLVVAISISGLVGRRTIQTERLELKDRQGNVRARLALGDDGAPKLAFFDARGEEQLTVQAREDTSSIELFDRGHVRVSLSSSNDGSSALHLFDKARNLPSTFYMWPEGSSGLLLSGGEAPLHLSSRADGPAKLSILDPNFKERGALWFNRDGEVNWRSDRVPAVTTLKTLTDPKMQTGQGEQSAL